MSETVAGVRPEDALTLLAKELRGETTVIAQYVVDPDGEPALGLLAAAGPRTQVAPAEYAQVVEAVREGYLLHYARPRLLGGIDGDLALLAGDYLYALGLDRLAALGDLAAVRELSDLISLCAQLHARDGADGAGALWLAATVAIAAGASEAHEQAKDAVRADRPDGVAELTAASESAAADAGLTDALRRAAETVGFRASDPR